MSGAGPLRGFPFGPPPPSACFGPPRPCSRRGRAVLGFSGYALPPSRFGRLRHCPDPDPAAAVRPHRAKYRPPAAVRPHRERPDPRGRCGWTAQGRAARPDRPTAERRPTERPDPTEGRTADLPTRCSLVPRSLLARSSLAARCARRGAQRSGSPAGAPRGEAPHTPAGLMGGPGAKLRILLRGSWVAFPGKKNSPPRIAALVGLLGGLA